MRAYKNKILHMEGGVGKNIQARRTFNRILGGQKEEAAFMQRFNSKNGIQTACFGSCAWMYLHFTSFNYNPDKINPASYQKLLEAFKETLPCGACRKNFETNYQAALDVLKTRDNITDIFENRYTYSKFIWEFHNQVNQALGKEQGPRFMDVADTYENCRARCVSSTTSGSESGCVEPEYKQPIKCVVQFVKRTKEDDTACQPLQMPDDCRRRK